MEYRRARIAGGTYFFTVNLANRSSRLLVEQISKNRGPKSGVRVAFLADH